MKTVQFEPVSEKLDVLTGTNLLQSLLAKKFNVLMACGGKGLCATCHVRVRSGMDRLTNRTERERMTLSFITGTDADSRLACQCRVLGDGVVVELPQGMYIERAEDLLSLLGTRAPTDILHPINGTVLVAKGKIITRTQITALQSLNVEMNRFQCENIARPADANPAPVPPSMPVPAARAVPARVLPPTSPAKPLPPVAPQPASRCEDKPQASRPTPSHAGTKPAGHPNKRFAIGATLGKCMLLEKIGQGATGTVYRAMHKTLNIAVAVKVLQFDDSESDRHRYTKFQSEARLLAQLNHPNIVRVWDFEADPFAPYLVLEHIEGLSLDELIRQSGRLQVDRAVPIIEQVAQALAAAWQLGVVHRDVKPANILLARDGTAKLADLGLALIVENEPNGSSKEAGPGLAGTVAYMSPEQAARADSVDHRSDIYALGATFYHAITGRFPFSGRTRIELLYKHANEPARPPQEIVPDLPAAVSAVILRMLAKKPENRFQDYADLRAALLELQAIPERPASSASLGGTTSSSRGTEVSPAEPAPRRTLLSILGWRRSPTNG
jgi:ferredoxin/tRNA A-37 threonylcarbamoyl transferase component Bud32